MLPPGLIDATPSLAGANAPRRAAARLQRAAVVPWRLCHADTALVGLIADPLDGLTSVPPAENALRDALDRLSQARADEAADLRPGDPTPGQRNGAARPLVPLPAAVARTAAGDVPPRPPVPRPAAAGARTGHRATAGDAPRGPLVPRLAAGGVPTGLRPTGMPREPQLTVASDSPGYEPPAPRPVPRRRVPRDRPQPTGPGSRPAEILTWPSPALARFAASVPGGPMAAATPVAALGDGEAPPVDHLERADPEPHAALRPGTTIAEEVRPEAFDHGDAESAPARGLAGLTRWWDDNSDVAVPSRPPRPLPPLDHAAPIDAQSLSEAMSKLFIAEARRYGIEVDGS